MNRYQSMDTGDREWRRQNMPAALEDTPRKVLLIQTPPADARVIRGALADARGGPFDVCWVRQLSEGLERLHSEKICAVFANLFLPDSRGIETLDRLLLVVPQVPIVIVCGLDDENMALRSVQRGARDYLLKGYLDGYVFSRALHNMIERKGLEDALFIEKERARVTLDSIDEAVLSTDLSGKITYLNLIAESMTGWSREDAVGRPLDEVFHVIDATTRKTGRNSVELAAEYDRTSSIVTNSILIRGDGLESCIENSAALVHDREGQPTGAVIVFRDVSAARAMTLQMAHSAQHDFLTGLPNRTLLNDRIGYAIALAPRHRKKVAVLFLDLDGFKHINDSLGHPIGDRLLQSIARRLVECVRGSDTVSRQGGDEFIVLLSELQRSEDAAITARKHLHAVAAAHSIDLHDLHVTASIGVSVYPDDGLDAETLIKNADTAMYQAKENGRQGYQFFKSAMNVRAVERQSVEESLRRALERREFTLQYQPKVNLKTGDVPGAEALIRWTHPTRGPLSPAQFIPISEDCGLILPIGRWVLLE